MATRVRSTVAPSAIAVTTFALAASTTARATLTFATGAATTTTLAFCSCSMPAASK